MVEAQIHMAKVNELYRQLLALMFVRAGEVGEEIKQIVDAVAEVDPTVHVKAQRITKVNQALMQTAEGLLTDEFGAGVFGVSARINSLAALLSERKTQDDKWGYVQHDGTGWLSILMEEIGEMAQDLNQGNDYREELIQVVAVAMSWLEAIECGATRCPGDAM